KEASLSKRTIDLIRGYLDEELDCCRPRPFQQDLCPQDIRAEKEIGVFDASINVRFGSKVYDNINPLIVKNLHNQLSVSDIPPDKHKMRLLCHLAEVIKV